MNNVIWKALTKRGFTVFQEQPQTGKYNLFTDMDKQDWIMFSIYNKTNNATYGINLKNGSFLINGASLMPSVQNTPYDIPCIPKQRFDYTTTLFWYNEIMEQPTNPHNKPECLNVYIGYKIPMNVQCSVDGVHGGKLIQARPMLKLNLKNNMASLSTSYKFQYGCDGKLIVVKG